MHHRKSTCMSIFSKVGLVDQSKPCTQIYLQKITTVLPPNVLPPNDRRTDGQTSRTTTICSFFRKKGKQVLKPECHAICQGYVDPIQLACTSLLFQK